MANDFINISKEVVNDFIQNVIFVDDRAHTNGKTLLEFDATSVASIFANDGKICAIYTPETIGNPDAFFKVMNKADAVVLDWDMREELNGDLNTIKNEEDEEDEDPRGRLTCNLINSIIQNAQGIKVILIYTGDTNVYGICDKIKGYVENAFYDEDNLRVFNDHIIVAVRAKYNDSDEQFKHIPLLKKFIVKYEKLPQCLIEQYVKLTNGLISNFALRALTTIRNSTPQILSVFSPTLDNGYMAHKASMAFSEDAYLLLIKLFGDALSDLLTCKMPYVSEWSEAWIDEFIGDDEIEINTVSISRTKELLKSILSSQQTTLGEKLKKILKEEKGRYVKEDFEKIEKAGPSITSLFSSGNNDLELSNVKFAELTHHKNIFSRQPIHPVLSLGSVIKDSNDKFYICIQQRCDSVRIKNKRQFLFLPLSKEGRNPVMIHGERFFPSRTTYAIKTIEFSTRKGEKVITAEIKDGKNIFVSNEGNKYEWIVDLKDLHAQRIANEYCSQLSRVGLDESEWLRLHGIN